MQADGLRILWGGQKKVYVSDFLRMGSRGEMGRTWGFRRYSLVWKSITNMSVGFRSSF